MAVEPACGKGRDDLWSTKLTCPMRCSKAQSLMDLYLADDALLGPEDKLRLEGHLRDCTPCRLTYQQGRHVVTLIQRYGQISEDTWALLEKAQARRGPAVPLLTRTILRASAVAACLVIGVLGWWAISNQGGSETGPEGLTGPAACSGEDASLTIELASDGTRLPPGATIQTSATEILDLVLNGRHQVAMNGGTRLSVEPLRQKGWAGCLVNLALGEVYVHVEHDGHPFVVQTAHAKAVVTGTTFDVKATQGSTTLVVAEGSVRFEAGQGVSFETSREERAVHVVAGQRSVITTIPATPSYPAACDVAALTAWASPAHRGRQVAQDLRTNDFLLDDSLLPSLRMAGPPDLEGIDYGQWIEQERDWFKVQFPWVFELKGALAGEGIEVDYPALLRQSGDLWRFAYPPAGLGRQMEPDPHGLFQAASRYGRDESWFKQQSFPSLRANRRVPQATGLEAFEQWAKTVEARINPCLLNTGSDVLLDSANACRYLVNTRTLAALAIRHRFAGVTPEVKDEVLRVLQEELQILGRCVSLSYELDLAKPNASMCETLQRLNTLSDGIRKVGELEKKVRKHEKVISQ